MKTVSDLAAIMRAKRESGSHPYVLLLGAGASVSSGTSLNRAVVERVVGSYDIAAFDKYLSQTSDDERFAILRDMVEGAEPSAGYRCLAELIRAGYFSVILSTNFDPLLEDAIAAINMRRRDYVFLVQGVMEPDFIAEHLDNPVPRVKLFKLHGDLFYNKFYYTGEEITRFPSSINRALHTYLNLRDIVVVGHGMRDTDINRCLRNRGSSIWYVSPQQPSDEIARIMRARKSQDSFISGEAGYFDPFFRNLRHTLLGEAPSASIDEIAQSIFSIGPVGKQPVGSGFLLGDKRLLITDSSVLALLGQGVGLGIRAVARAFGGGPERQAELAISPETELDYAVFRIPRLVEVSPLELAEELPEAGDPVTACVSVGTTQGFRDGTITGTEKSVPLQMANGETVTIGNLIETDIKIEPGACGSPLVRKDGRVVGVLVAGNGHSYALTSARLSTMLHRAGLV